MAMDKRGLTKLMEECGELTQVAAKRSAYMSGDHPDGAGDLNLRLESEIADVMAACQFVLMEFGLNAGSVETRRAEKLERFLRWQKED